MSDFASQYGIRLNRETNQTMSWWEFMDYLHGLMAADCRITRFLNASSPTSDRRVDDGGS